MIELKHYSPDTLPLPLKYQLLATVRIEWFQAFTGPGRTWDYIAKSTQPQYFTLSEQDILISFAEVNQRPLHHANEAYTLYGLSAVYTFPAYRHEGYGQQVVQAAADFIRASDADIAMLFCSPALTDFYHARGWQTLPTTIIHYGNPDQPQVNQDVVMMQFISDEGRQHQSTFVGQPVYVGRYRW
ncbi:MAG: GNAT family N-acetyltransferase [Cyanobacteria bacterium P01_H01_bin.153]